MTREYRFSKPNHRHELLIDGEWKPMTGVTSILQVIAKPALIQWAANMAVDYITEHSNFIGEVDDESKKNKEGLIDIPIKNWLVSPNTLEEARKAHRRKKEEAGNIGTLIHKEIELWIKSQIGQ